jgi:hypothetical protein
VTRASFSDERAWLRWPLPDADFTWVKISGKTGLEVTLKCWVGGKRAGLESRYARESNLGPPGASQCA